MRFTRWTLLLLLACALAAVPAAADTMTYTINKMNIVGYTGPFATVTVDRTSTTTANITFQSLIKGGNDYLMGDSQAADLNVNGAFTVGTITGTNSIAGFTPGPYTQEGSGTVDGFGTFNLRLKSKDGFTHGAETITFTLALTSGSWATVADVLTGNDKGYSVGMHVFACPEPGCSVGAGVPDTGTGFAVDGPVVPEPASLALFGGGLIGLGSIVRKRHFARR